MAGPKEIRVMVSADQHEELTDAKGDRTWREAMLEEFGVEE